MNFLNYKTKKCLQGVVLGRAGLYHTIFGKYGTLKINHLIFLKIDSTPY